MLGAIFPTLYCEFSIVSMCKFNAQSAAKTFQWNPINDHFQFFFINIVYDGIVKKKHK